MTAFDLELTLDKSKMIVVKYAVQGDVSDGV